ncbi:MAG: hypothetical protein A3C80_03760 [Candidatus Ryanbacteria bacterium RIFCSPHIGHO2_02_FULL_45_43]|uniref:Vitamin K epoxide reductase domain-containing protein n=1 Tax=Candidatus Ryanbacteria bacterium RIFCSPHIGHO2_01_45_13 TaxID=1802112 RepID=A0A1G2FZG5_9BACT|nr:MAG: hypothetical protein A2718_03020 [Candidatus Ryanbacteria bacterium RIFCSPHIGHO2_01_FULL_44_130]OGZ43132.1 MAG: hypothetical protein A2W41_00355 [Candidatus Ryanbacteria bacterium RIFCSPHIGHO2_01_45_13]OGZ47793.1 MAG: hypothetical protein A3C80_03760 [Candidatus Ryanbacteria bacterium RIFCSPHIGHO2_02_FULL_45_43]OGZ49686.1 MAG: hypothetical protein A3E55_02215 [Candidatus Ryanbacteria bacterium RIFCSPHIGHO2_12_FULL_44_20]OGZ52179.1 MAG: hypothetical protein A3A17_03080 [Candidatus Ryanba
MTPHTLLFTLAAIGISETAYLIRKRRALEQPICPLGEDCVSVLHSKYNRIAGVYNDVLGFGFYVVLSFLAAFIVLGLEPFSTPVFATRLLLVFGTMLSLRFIYLQWRVIQSWCFWCLMSAVTIFGMTVIAFVSDLAMP